MALTPEGPKGTPLPAPAGSTEQPPARELEATTTGARERFSLVQGGAANLDLEEMPELDLAGAEVVLGPNDTFDIAGYQVGSPEALAAAAADRRATGAPTVAGKVPLGTDEKVVIGGNGKPVIKKV